MARQLKTLEEEGYPQRSPLLPTSAGLVQVLSPVYNEGAGILKLYEQLILAFNDFDKLTFVYDSKSDTTVPYISILSEKDSRVVGQLNSYGKGVVNAMRWGFDHSQAGPVVVIMADCSDKLDIIPEMISLWKRGAVVVSPSRYMSGGKQHGGPRFKKFLSGSAGRLLGSLGFPTSDPTNNYKLYDGDWLISQKIESTGGFEIALELTSKAFRQGETIAQLPTEWWDRTEGESNFKMWQWIPKYLRWYLPLLVRTPLKVIGVKI